MHAAITTVSIDAGKETEARALLSSQIVPMVKQAPGFIAGYWTEPKADKGFSVVIFDSEESARAALPAVGFRAPGSPLSSRASNFARSSNRLRADPLHSSERDQSQSSIT